MAGEYVFNLQRVTRRHNHKTVLEDVSLAFFFGAHIGVIGANGSGKSSLLRILAGVDGEFMGTCQVARNLRIGYLEQEPHLSPGSSVAQSVDEGVAVSRALLDRYDEVCDLLGSAGADECARLNDELGRLQDTIDAHDLWNLDHLVELAMEALRLPPPDTSVDTLSGGERRRVALCRLLISNPDVLLLDEPTNHLDAESVAWIEAYLKRYRGTLVVVTHDRYFLNNVTEWILELDNGHAYPFKGNYESWLEQKQQVMEREMRQGASRSKLLEGELRWMRTNPSGRRARNKARIARYEELAKQTVDTRADNLSIRIPPGPHLGELVVRAENLAMGFGDRLLFENLSFDLPRGGIVGVIGANGSGKTTLFNLITGQQPPLAGTLTIGTSVVLSYVDQMRDALDPQHTLYEEVTGGEEFIALGGSRMNGRAYCSRFNFKGADQQKSVGQLSGGERNRVHLAKLLRGGGNLLLLDEPTNDLDVDTLRALEEGLRDFGGSVMTISHDRWFLDRVATHILAFEGDGKVTWFEGNYQDYHAQRRKLLGEAADRPTRLRFRPISH